MTPKGDTAEGPRIGIIAQARMSSSRLPGKVLLDLCGKPVIDRVLERAMESTLASDLIVATTTDASDDALHAHVVGLGVRCVRGSLEDVLSRYRLAAQAVGVDIVVRITCDCPFIDPSVIDSVIAAYLTEPTVDYCSNTLRRTYPLGMDTEVFSSEALRRADEATTRPDEREHVTPYLYRNPELFRLRNVEAPRWATRPEIRLTVDESADLSLAREVVSRVGADASLRTILSRLAAEPELLAMNAGVQHRHVEMRSGS